jgi:hypothetical protein
MRRLELMALRALSGRHRLEGVVRPPLGGPGLGMTTFRIRHGDDVSASIDLSIDLLTYRSISQL